VRGRGCAALLARGTGRIARGRDGHGGVDRQGGRARVRCSGWGGGSWGERGEVVVVDGGVRGVVVDGRAVARFRDRVKVVWERGGRGRRVGAADEPLACALRVQHEIERSLWSRFDNRQFFLVEVFIFF